MANNKEGTAQRWQTTSEFQHLIHPRHAKQSSKNPPKSIHATQERSESRQKTQSLHLLRPNKYTPLRRDSAIAIPFSAISMEKNGPLLAPLVNGHLTEISLLRTSKWHIKCVEEKKSLSCVSERQAAYDPHLSLDSQMFFCAGDCCWGKSWSRVSPLAFCFAWGHFPLCVCVLLRSFLRPSWCSQFSFLLSLKGETLSAEDPRSMDARSISLGDPKRATHGFLKGEQVTEEIVVAQKSNETHAIYIYIYCLSYEKEERSYKSQDTSVSSKEITGHLVAPWGLT